MKRLTYRGENGKGYVFSEYHGSNSTERKRAIVADRLAAYEDTGLSPEEIMVKDDILMCAAIVLGTSIDHIRDLLAAEKEGRVVVLPCARNGAELYFADAFRGEIYKEAYTAGLGLFWTNDSEIGDYVPLSCIGKTIFLTRAEAETALGGAVDHE